MPPTRSARAGTSSTARAPRAGRRGGTAPRTGGAVSKSAPKQPRRRRWLTPAVVGLVLLALGGLYLTFRSSAAPDPGGSGDSRTYQVGTPGIGAAAVPFTLPSTAGEPVSLSDYRGATVLLYFHEGLGCQPCWDQIRDLENRADALRAAGIDDLLTITSGPRDLIAQKMSDDNLSATALADTDLSVSVKYNANQYGMMGTSRDGHSFILVGPDGRIQWRADYGGAPRYTMYVPVDRLLSDLKAGRASR